MVVVGLEGSFPLPTLLPPLLNGQLEQAQKKQTALIKMLDKQSTNVSI